jgi:hypothetical protein
MWEAWKNVETAAPYDGELCRERGGVCNCVVAIVTTGVDGAVLLGEGLDVRR